MFESIMKENSFGTRRWLIWFCGLGGLLSIGFAIQYLSDPLSIAPVLDARENLAWAERIAIDTLPEEPSYRALLYPWILSLFSFAGDFLPQVASFLGVLFHLISAGLVGRLAFRLWSSVSAAWAATGLYACYPVSQYFAVQVLDITFAITLFLGALVCLFEGHFSRRHLLWWSLCGILAGLAVLARPNFLPAVVVLPLFFVISSPASPLARRCRGAAGLCGSLVAILLLQGMWNLQQSGQFRILPWQGAYNLYAANREGANGKYYMQRINFDAVPAGMNSTRMESEHLYAEATGDDGAPDISAMNAYWRAQLMDAVNDNPTRWIGLMSRKVLYLFNDWEQYNNLTYAYHKERFPILRWNPLGWGLLLLGAALGIVGGWRRMAKPQAGALALVFLGYAGGVLLFFVSARFRLPLAPLLCVFCGGIIFLTVARLRSIGGLRLSALALALGFIALLSYGNWFEARDRTTFIQDELLLADASLEAGNDRAALKYGNAVLSRDSGRDEARRIQVSALFNLWLMSPDGAGRESHWRALQTAVDAVEVPDASIFFIRGVVAWRHGDQFEAIESWRTGLSQYGTEATSSAQALQAVGEGIYFEVENPGVSAVRNLLE